MLKRIVFPFLVVLYLLATITDIGRDYTSYRVALGQVIKYENVSSDVDTSKQLMTANFCDAYRKIQVKIVEIYRIKYPAKIMKLSEINELANKIVDPKTEYWCHQIPRDPRSEWNPDLMVGVDMKNLKGN